MAALKSSRDAARVGLRQTQAQLCSLQRQDMLFSPRYWMPSAKPASRPV
ncbi:hypothetical protein CNE_2c16250 [Cupriavidus necator N-1]|uniref:Uncharacterized protein n=1 Tax=Cupriavidus necator (strain ATCC 43291 / DSM 13513 / CCUG 52238 / LMG 8453 / N-1) TaxID=1042878 RepID=F8GPU4_CUPNN|nr:hypothetical protein CNE_2c16250 [Cupriavidus necator N-1]KAI3595566.1 hypothetical protein D8I24_8187 [Cupriavidus necator H850]